MQLNIHNTFTKYLPADVEEKNFIRQVNDVCFSYCKPELLDSPTLIHASKNVAEFIGINTQDITSNDFLSVFSGQKPYPNTQSYAMCYGGHQFGQWAGQLGDGRAINLFEIKKNDQLFALQLKGAGRTPYSRNADGLAVLRSSIREHLCSEAMYYLGVPTTRSLALIQTGNDVVRDMLYNGHPAYEKGAIVCRVSETFIRFGNFEILSARKNYQTLQQLVDYTIQHFFTEIKSKGKEKVLDFFNAVLQKTITMIVHWNRIGFVHGVMNTDNMSIIGNTIDFGPFGFLDDYNIYFTPNTTDLPNKRYCFKNQPSIALWNLVQFANALYPLVNEEKPFEEILNSYNTIFHKENNAMLFQKLGIETTKDILLIDELEKTLQLAEIDFTIFYRSLANIYKEDEINIAFKKIKTAFYNCDTTTVEIEQKWKNWLQKYLKHLQQESITDELKMKKMNAINPKYILRNYMAQMAIDEANNENYELIKELYLLLQKPYDEQPELEKWFAKRPDWAREKVGCSMLSCSS